MRRPRVLIQRKIAIHDPHLVLVTLQQGGEELRVHLGAERALKVVKSHDQHWRIRSAASRGAVPGDHHILRILADVELVELRQRLAVGGEQEGDRFAARAVLLEGHGNRVEAGDLAFGSRTDLYVVLRVTSDRDLISSSTRRACSADNAPSTAGGGGVCAWQPIATSDSANNIVRNGLNPANTMLRLSHAETHPPPARARQLQQSRGQSEQPR